MPFGYGIRKTLPPRKNVPRVYSSIFLYRCIFQVKRIVFLAIGKEVISLLDSAFSEVILERSSKRHREGMSVMV